MLDKSCSECNRLWREYRSATAEHLNLKRQMELVSYDSGLCEIVKSFASVSEHLQEIVQIKMQEHEASHHHFRPAQRSA